MACHAIKISNPHKWSCCRHYPMDGSDFCFHHKDITPEDHKDRWIAKYILGRDGNTFFYSFAEQKKNRILRDLNSKKIVLTDEDLLRIPTRKQYLDIYVLLVENGFVQVDQHRGLYLETLDYFLDTSAMRNPMFLKIRDEVVLKDGNHFHKFLQKIAYVMKMTKYQQRFPEIQSLLVELLLSNAARELSWRPFTSDLLKHYTSCFGENHPIVLFLKDTYVPHFLRMYQQEKKLQQVRSEFFKEELMAYCWHPERFQEWCLDEEEKREIEEAYA